MITKLFGAYLHFLPDMYLKGTLPLLSIWVFIFFAPACRNKSRTWSIYKADTKSTSYADLTQINTNNVTGLKVAWTFTPNDAMEGARFGSSECNPIIVDGILYASSARHRIYAIDAATGKQSW